MNRLTTLPRKKEWGQRVCKIKLCQDTVANIPLILIQVALHLALQDRVQHLLQ